MEALLIVAGIAAFAYFLFQNARLTAKAADDPRNMEAATTDTLGQKTSLSHGPWTITFIRQSGNVHRVDSAATPEEAVRKVQAAFRRAKIDLVRLSANSPSGFTAMRAIYNGRGSSEGKKLGGAVVSRSL